MLASPLDGCSANRTPKRTVRVRVTRVLEGPSVALVPFGNRSPTIGMEAAYANPVLPTIGPVRSPS
jgi:hypothetical protein